MLALSAFRFCAVFACLQATIVATTHEDDRLSLLQVGARPVWPIARRLNVGFAVFVTDIANAAFKDAISIMAFSALKAAKKSKHKISVLAFVPERFDAQSELFLRSVGFEDVVRKPVPVLATDIQGEYARREMSKTNGVALGLNFEQAEETIKYWGLADTRFDRVLVMDADVLVLDPMDELLERDEDFIGVYDHGLDQGLDSTMPPAQGGFLLFRPSMSDFHAITALTREGNWSGEGWKQSGIGYCYGGVGPDGLLAYYFNKDALPQLRLVGKSALPEGVVSVNGSRMFAADRAIYDVVVNDRLVQEMANVGDHDEAVKAVKSVHFTGDCNKPWRCTQQPAQDSQQWFCSGLMERWWQLRGELAKARGVPEDTVALGRDGACNAGVYTSLPENAPA